MSESKQSVVAKAAPWRRGAAWWLVLGEGIVLLVVGVLFIVLPQKALNTFGLLLAAYLAISGGLQLYAGLRGRDQLQAGQAMLIRGGIGLGVGLLVLLMRVANVLSVDSFVWILGLGLLVYAALGLYGVYLARASGGIPWGLLVNSVILLVLALLLFYAELTDTPIFLGALDWLTVFTLVGGALLTVYGYLLFRSQKNK